jgi:purine-nucleoside phosphorylase
LCCGRPHLYEGWPAAALRRVIDDLAAWGVGRLVLTNAAGGLDDDAQPGSALVVDEVVDLQRAPATEPDVLPATPPSLASAAEAALSSWLPVRRGRYVAVPGPQYETPAEARWLAAMGAAVGMSTASELRAAADNGQQTCVVSLVVNRSGTDAVHADVLAAGLRLADGLRPGVAALLRACWPGVFADDCNDADRRQENQWT